MSAEPVAGELAADRLHAGAARPAHLPLLGALELTVRRVAALLLAAVVVVALVSPKNSWFVFERVVVLPVLAVSLGVAWLLARRPPRAVPVPVGTVLGAVLGSAQAFVSAAPYGWDAWGVRVRAYILATSGGLLRADRLYVAEYPNNLPLLGIETTVGRFVRAVGMSMDGALVALQVLTYVVLVHCVGLAVLRSGRPRAVLPAQLLVIALVGLSPALAVPYSDIPAAACVAGVLSLAAAGRWLRAGLALGLGLALKPFVLALGIGLAFVLVVRRAWRPLAAVVLVAGVVAAGAAPVGRALTGLSAATIASSGSPFPPEHFLAMGTHDTRSTSPTRRYGGYLQRQVDLTARTPPAQRRRVLRAIVADQLRTTSPAFFGAKIAWIWGDGTFWAQGEGTDHSRPSAHGPGLLRDLSAYTRAPGAAYVHKGSAVQGLWLAAVVLAALALWRRRGAAVTALGLTLLAQTAYLTFFEARPRYLLPFVACVVVLAALSGRRDPSAGPTGPRGRHRLPGVRAHGLGLRGRGSLPEVLEDPADGWDDRRSRPARH